MKEKFVISDAKILIVDDNLVNLKVIRGNLKPYKMKIDTAKSGKECVDLFRDNDYNAIFLDHLMPKMDGVETLLKLKSLYPQKLDNVAVVAMSANKDELAEEYFLKNGFSFFISKPFDKDRLEKLLLKCIPAHMIKTEYINLEDYDDKEKTIYLKENLPLLDVDKGILNSGENIDEYIDILKIAYNDGIRKVREIKKLFNDKKYASYLIEIHALKSVAGIIGAGELEKYVRIHESRLRNENFDEIEENAEKIQNLYNELLEQIENVIIKDKESLGEEKKFEDVEITFFELETLNHIIELLDIYDYDTTHSILDNIIDKCKHKSLYMCCKKALEALEDFEYEEAQKILQEFMFIHE